MNVAILMAVLLLFVVPARAQQPEPQSQPQPGVPVGSPPCSRGSTQLRIMDVDIDALRCRVSLDLQRIAELENTLLTTITQQRLQDSETSAEKAAHAKHQQDLAAWFRGWFGDPPPPPIPTAADMPAEPPQPVRIPGQHQAPSGPVRPNSPPGAPQPQEPPTPAPQPQEPQLLPGGTRPAK